MGKIKDLAIIDKPREKAQRFGIESLKDEELLALIINSGTVGHSSLDIARDLLKESPYLSDLLNKPAQYFTSFKGLKTAKAIKLLAALEIARRINEKQRLIYEETTEITNESLYQRYSLSLNRLTQEVLVIIILNKNKKIIFEKTLYQGDDHNLAVNSRDILRLLIANNGYYFYLIHNHPNDTSYPSELDIKFTKKIKEKAQRISAILLDHLIIYKGGYYSFLNEQICEERSQYVT